MALIFLPSLLQWILYLNFTYLVVLKVDAYFLIDSLYQSIVSYVVLKNMYFISTYQQIIHRVSGYSL